MKVRKGQKKTDFFRVAVSGTTVDGREITAEQINEMAEIYDPTVYGARVNLEHIRSWSSDSEFSMYGDVLALKAEDCEILGEKRRGLYAQFAVNKELVEINQKNQKIYSSIELRPNFAGTGKAYLVGLACTDSPASLGTEALCFSRQFGVETFVTDYIEGEFSLIDDEEPTKEKKFSIAKFVADLFKEKDDFNRKDLEDAFAEIAKVFDEQKEEFTTSFDVQKAELENLRNEFNALKSQLAAEPATTQTFTPTIELGNPNDGGFGSTEY